ncbi:MAG: flagellar hook-length control protein FliK [Bacillota bacterium]|nr:flagellar hook-length control protein FliK [Bacillota bacterium]
MRTTEAAISPALVSPQGNRLGQGRLQEKTGDNFSALLEGIFSSSNEEDVRQPEGEQAMPGMVNGLMFSFHPEYPEMETGELLQEQEQTIREFGQNFLQDLIPPEIIGQWDELAPPEKELVRFILTSIADDSLQTEKTIMDNGISGKQHLDLQNSLDDLLQDVSQNRGNNALPKSDLFLQNEQGALNPKAGAFIASMLREGKSLQELPPAILQELENYISGKITSDEDLSRERSFPTILSRLEGFLHACLGEEREGQETFTGPFFSEEGEKGDSGASNRNPMLFPEVGEGRFPLNSTFQDEGGVKAPFISSYGQPREYAMLHPKEILSQIVGRMEFLARPGEQELRLKLEPEFLGQVLIRVRFMNEKLTGEIITSHLAVKELLEGQLETLRQRFWEMDLNIEHFNVSVRDEAHDGSPFGRGPQSEDFPWGDRSESLKEGERVLSSSGSLWGSTRMVDYFV